MNSKISIEWLNKYYRFKIEMDIVVNNNINK